MRLSKHKKTSSVKQLILLIHKSKPKQDYRWADVTCVGEDKTAREDSCTGKELLLFGLTC